MMKVKMKTDVVSLTQHVALPAEQPQPPQLLLRQLLLRLLRLLVQALAAPKQPLGCRLEEGEPEQVQGGP